MKTENEKYCQECGAVINIKAVICPKCGVSQPLSKIQTNETSTIDDKWLIALLLCIFLGPLGIHRFYTGHTKTGIIQLITFGGCGIWALIDLITIAMGKFKDGKGNLIKNA